MQPLRPPRRRQSALRMSLVSLALLAGCTGIGDDDAGSGLVTLTGNPGGSGALGAFFMPGITPGWSAAAASFRNNSSRFRFQDGTVDVHGNRIFANPLHSSRVDHAHALGLSGAGAVIAVVDNGFRLTHEAFAGKSNTTTGGPPVRDHGTKVASVAAGNSARMVGVAPGAALILSDWAYGDLTAAAHAARDRRAVAQNNSWGFSDRFINVDAHHAEIFGNPTGTAWLAALKDYADAGVVIFALSNAETAGNAGLMEALPLREPELTPGWLAVGNATPVFDDSGVSAVARRHSAGCLQAAQWCLMADGHWTAASGTSNADYAEGFGSSFAAPQVAGALALLAEAFPALTPHQLRARLLASADNRFTGFGTPLAMDVLDGPGVHMRNYSTEFGHGFLDIRAALLPIGPVTLAAPGGGKIMTQDFAFSTGGALGDAVTRSLEGIELRATDALETGFYLPAKAFATPTRPVALARTRAARSFGSDLRALRTAPVNPLAEVFAAHPGSTLDLAGPDGRLRAAVLIGQGGEHGVALSRGLTAGDLRLDLGVKLARDGGSLMGFSAAGDGGGAVMSALTLGLAFDTGSGGFFALSGEIGRADLAGTAAVTDVSAVGYDSLSLAFGGRDVLARGDRLTLGLSRPVAATSGSARMQVPVALADGGAELRAVSLELAPSARQVDLSLGYQAPMGDRSEILFELVHAENHGNRAGISDRAVVVGMSWRF